MRFDFPGEALDLLMPMHLAVSHDGQVLHAGPTLAKLFPEHPEGRRFFDLFAVRRPGGIGTMAALPHGQRLHLGVAGSPVTLRGAAMPMCGGLILNLSFGIGLLEAIRHYGLTDSDFAATDLTMEMLYVVEAKSAVMEELGQLNLRLQGAKSEAEEQALTDTLTGLRNRRGLDAALSGLIAADQPFSLLHMDLDFFKQVNDMYGHATGDEVLRRVARILSEETRRGDTVTRIGGDEFVVVLPGLGECDLPEGIARRIVARMNEPIDVDGRICRISISIGVTSSALYDRPDPEIMLNDADQALYASKHGGRSQVRRVR
ncbi:GGDEF domain-containing protein [Cereibacter sp. SYSU M97828]|nr:GGDEF domain-containing protein [Cereibacter flavus]